MRITRKPRCFSTPHAIRRRTVGVALAMLALMSALKANAADASLELRAADGTVLSPLALETSVDFRIRGLLAEVVVHQRYRNDSAQWMEGRYLLPLPHDAAVGRLDVAVGERRIVGEVREKAQAQAIYQAAAQQGQAAALVEQDRPDLFRTAVANIAPGDVVDVEIGYWQSVGYRDGEFSISLPLTLTPRYDSAIGAEGPPQAAAAVVGTTPAPASIEPNVTLRIELQAGVALSAITSPTHPIDVQRRDGYDLIELARSVEPTDRDFELRWQPLPSTQPQRAVFTEEVDGEHYALVLLVPPTRDTEPVARELILVLDHSGSMIGEAMQQAQAALDVALQQLQPDDRFNVVRFNDTAARLFDESVPATAEHVAEARAFVAGLRAEGGTELAPALQLALQGRPTPGRLRQVVLATDAAISDEQALLAQIERLRGDARLFPLGIGSAPNQFFLQRAALLGRGTSTLVRNLDEVQPRMEGLLARLDHPVLQDLEVRFPGAADVYPQRLPDLYHGEPLQIVARLPAMTGTIDVRGIARQQPWTSKASLNAAQTIPADGVARLWARARIDELEDQLRTGSSENEIRPAIVETALRHGLASRYTSLVAVEQLPTRPHDAPLASSEIVNAAPAGSIGMAQGSTGARGRFGLAIAIALLMAALLKRRT